ncbi:MAG: MFS transporter [Fimbriimonadaceae bacterium]
MSSSEQEHLVKDWGSIGGVSLIPYTGVLIGFTIALYSIAQFAMVPYLGRLSDHAGRRRVLIITCTLAVVAQCMPTPTT